MDTFTIKLLIFFAVVIAIRFLTRRFPDSLFTRITYSWYGPTPKVGEARSHYFFSWAIYALKWFIFFVLILSIAMTIADRYFQDQYRENFYFQMLFMFGIPLLSVTAFVGSIGFLVKGIYLKLLKKDSFFEMVDKR